MYARKTKSAAELSAALSRASKSRRSCRGGRPKGWRKNPEDSQPSTTLSVGALDAEIFKAFATSKGWSMRQSLHTIAAMMIRGGSFSAHRVFTPSGWKWIPPSKQQGKG